MTRRAGIIVIGDEVLSGKVDEINSTFLIRELREMGCQIDRVAMVRDQIDAISDEIQRCSRACEFVITTGGIGPTHDDMTFEAVARAFDVELEHSDEIDDCIRKFFGEDYAQPYRKLAQIPAGTELIWSEGLPFPVTRVRNVYVMPGEPTVLRLKFDGIRNQFASTPYHLRRVFTLLDEGSLADRLAELEASDEAIAVGSYPVYDQRDYRVQITIESKNRDAVEKAFERLISELPSDQIVRTS